MTVNGQAIAIGGASGEPPERDRRERRARRSDACGSGSRLLRVSRLIEAELRERLRAEFDTTLPRFDVMAALRRRRMA